MEPLTGVDQGTGRTSRTVQSGETVLNFSAVSHRFDRKADFVSPQAEIASLFGQRTSTDPLEVVERGDAIFSKSFCFTEWNFSWDLADSSSDGRDHDPGENFDCLRSGHDEDWPTSGVDLGPPNLALSGCGHHGSSSTSALVARSRPAVSTTVCGERRYAALICAPTLCLRWRSISCSSPIRTASERLLTTPSLTRSSTSLASCSSMRVTNCAMQKEYHFALHNGIEGVADI